MAWTVEVLNEIVEAEIAVFPADMRGRLAWISKRIEDIGLGSVSDPHVRQLKGKLWEMRPNGRAGIGRALYVAAPEQRVVILRAFVKKTQKTPRREIDLALARARN